jgi:hypothetical protein
MMSKKENFKWYHLLLIVGLVLFIVYYLLTLGNGKVPKVKIVPDAFKGTYDFALNRHRKLKLLASKQLQLKKKLERVFKGTYLAIRIGLVVFWLGIMFVFWKIDHINDLEDFLNYSEASILVIITLNFLTFGKLTNLNEFLSRIKIRTENWIYGKYITLDERIETTIIEKQDLQIQLNQLNDLKVDNIEIGSNA